MTNKEIKNISELYKQQYQEFKETGFDHTYDTLKGMQQILKALGIDTLHLENEIDCKEMHTYEKMAYETITVIFDKYEIKSFKWKYDKVNDIFDNLQFQMTEEDQNDIKINLNLIKEYKKAKVGILLQNT